MILAQNLEAAFPSRPLASVFSVPLRALCVEVLYRLCRRIMFPSKPFSSNTSKTVWNCSFQKTYSNAKSFSSNTYKKPRGWGADPLVHYIIASSRAPVTLPRTSLNHFLDFPSTRVSLGEKAASSLHFGRAANPSQPGATRSLL